MRMWFLKYQTTTIHKVTKALSNVGPGSCKIIRRNSFKNVSRWCPFNNKRSDAQNKIEDDEAFLSKNFLLRSIQTVQIMQEVPTFEGPVKRERRTGLGDGRAMNENVINGLLPIPTWYQILVSVVCVCDQWTPRSKYRQPFTCFDL